MSKKRFIQAVVIRSLPAHGKLTEAVRYAENLWDGLTHLGYGQDKQEPRDSRDFYAELSERQQQQFRRFWQAFDYKKDRNGAAMRWGQLGDLSDAEAQRIIDAAQKEAHKALPQGQSRKMAQGWLFEKRWLDYAPAPEQNHRQRHTRRQHLINELDSVKLLYEKTGNTALLTQIDKLQQALEVQPHD